MLRDSRCCFLRSECWDAPCDCGRPSQQPYACHRDVRQYAALELSCCLTCGAQLRWMHVGRARGRVHERLRLQYPMLPVLFEHGR